MELPEHVWSRVITEAAALGTEVVVFTGGEPLLVPFVERLIDLASGLGILPGLVTNGELIPKYSHGLVSGGVGLVWISLLGPTASINDAITGRLGSFQHKIEAFRALSVAAARHDIVLMANVVVEPRNYRHVYETLRVLAQESVAIAYIEEVVCAGHAKSKSRYFLKEQQREVALAQMRQAQEDFPFLVSITRTLDRSAGEHHPPPSDFLNITPDGFLTEAESRIPEREMCVAGRPLAELVCIWAKQHIKTNTNIPGD